MATDELPQPGSAEQNEPSLTPERIERQAFPRARKGVDENEVRAFLRRVADEHEALTGRIADLEEQVRKPQLPSEQQLVDMVSDEVARTLRSAQESAEGVQARAREHAIGIERAAQEEAQRVREEQLEQATADAQATIEAARDRGREMVAEARALRERVLADLNRRRDMLRAYIEQIRDDRDRFTEAYRIVRKMVGDATELLGRFESGRPFPQVPVEAGPAPAYARERTAALDAEADGEARPQPEPPPAADSAAPSSKPAETRSTATGIGLGELPEEPSSDPNAEAEASPLEPSPEPEPEPRAEPEPKPAHAEHAPEPEYARERGSDVDALFARMRAGPDQGPQKAPAVVDEQADGQKQEAPKPGSAATATPAPDAGAATATAAAEPEPPPEEPVGSDGELLARRDELLTPLAHDLVRRCKRVLQDEQNDVLDALRRQRGRVVPDKVLPPLAQQVTAWSEVMAPAIIEAYVGARAAASPEREPVNSAPQRIVTGMIEVLVTPLRERLLSGFDDIPVGDADADTIGQRIGARYREWKGEELDGRIGDLLAAVYARGVYDAVPDGSRLRWIPAEQGQCPDADDNALEPTARGERFPTGQQFPPAHPGCRCLLGVVLDGHGD